MKWVATAALLAFNSWVATICIRSDDWRDQTLGWVVLIVYIFVVGYQLTRFAKDRFFTSCKRHA